MNSEQEQIRQYEMVLKLQHPLHLQEEEVVERFIHVEIEKLQTSEHEDHMTKDYVNMMKNEKR